MPYKSYLRQLGAVYLDAPYPSAVPAHYGNHLQEQEYLLAGKGWVDLSDYEVLTITGLDRQKWLHSLTTCPFEFMQTGETRDMLLLDPQGYIEHQALAMDDGTKVWLLVEPGKATALQEFLERMKFMMRVEITQVPVKIIAALRSLSTASQDEQAVSALKASMEDLRQATPITTVSHWIDRWPVVLAGGAHYGIENAQHLGAGYERHYFAFPYDSAEQDTSASENISIIKVLKKLQAQQLPPVGYLAWEASRIRHARPGANEIGQRTLPHELDWLRTGVHLEKGCYRGQETVAKIVNLGRPPRRITFLYLEGMAEELPLPGAPILHGTRPVGTITAAAQDFEYGPVALAIVKRSVPVEAVLQVGEWVATQEMLVDPAGKSSQSPAQRPGSELRANRL